MGAGISVNRLFCFGLGYSARRLARALMEEGWEIAGTVRDAARASLFEREGIEAAVFDGGSATDEVPALLRGSTHVLDSIPPAGGRACVPLAFFADAVARLERLRWCGYLSTTGVYGDHRGGWVDEATPARPSLRRGRMRVEAEQAWLIMHERYGLPVHVCRLAGS